MVFNFALSKKNTKDVIPNIGFGIGLQILFNKGSIPFGISFFFEVTQQNYYLRKKKILLKTTPLKKESPNSSFEKAGDQYTLLNSIIYEDEVTCISCFGLHQYNISTASQR